MEPRIQYAQTADGVSIAYWTLGEGIPLVWMPNMPFHHIQLGLEQPEVRNTVEWAAQRAQLIAYDARGCGLSDRDVANFSLDSYVMDLEAVVDRLELERFALVGGTQSGPVAIAYAVRDPERVSHLILNTTYARGADIYRSPQAQAFRALRDQDWNIYTETIAHTFVGWSSGEAAERNAAFLRECVTQEGARATWRAVEEFDVTELLPQVRSPTLVLGRRESLWVPVELSRRVASGIPGASFVVLEAASGVQMYDIPSAKAIDEFLREGEEAAATPELPEGMAVLLFADIAESTALTEQIGDAAFRAKARELDTSLRSVIRESGGTPVEGKVLGDGVLAVFTSARQAIDCALRCEAAGEPLGLQLHLGIHAGDVIREGNNVYGGAVNIAARIAAASQPGEVLVSQTVRDLARTSAGVTFDDRGQRKLKGVEGRRRLFAVGGEAGA